MTEQQKSFLANGIFRAITQDMPELIYENELPTTVGSGLFRWNFINRNLSEGPGIEFETSFQKRGAWKFLILRDYATNFSISIMSEQNFRKLQHHPSLQPHYLEALVFHNKVREPIEGQLHLEGMHTERGPSILSELRNQLLSGFTGIVDEHILLLFDYDYTGVTSARAVLLTPSLDIAVSDNWTAYLKTTYIPRQSSISPILPEEELVVKLKSEYLPQDNDLTALHVDQMNHVVNAKQE